MLPQFQSGLEWLQWRVLGVGSSDGPVITGKSEYKTKLELWDEKFNKIVKEDEPNFIQQKGHKLEIFGRTIMEFRTGYEWKPRLFVHSQYEFIRASMDGWAEEINEGWECKYMGKALYLALTDTTKSILERIPPQYLDQICHQFFVTGARAITLTGICDSLEVDENGNKMKTVGHLRIPLTDELMSYIQNEYMPQVFAFWESIVAGVRPEPVKDDVVAITDKTLGDLILNYEKVDKEIKRYTKIKEAHKDLIFNHAARVHSKMAYEGNQIMVVPGGKSVDYEAAFTAFCSWIHQLKTAALNFEIDQHSVWQSVTSFPDKPNLETYTKVSKDSFKIIPVKEKKEKKEKDDKKTDAPGIHENDNAGIQTATMASGISEGDGQQPDPKTIVDLVSKNSPALTDRFDFKNPITQKRPRGWETKTLREKCDYCIKQSKLAGIGAPSIKVFLDFAEMLEKEIEKEESTPAVETVGGITFSKE